ncbi:unnamed protein product [Meloidogyne enterolobii]|uniref:Uncharacterized protein n=1 Tax=Meloidogyne enterolobii TaxID=390850 RepID=A0ACB1ADY2_MELEN
MRVITPPHQTINWTNCHFLVTQPTLGLVVECSVLWQLVRFLLKEFSHNY